MDDRGALHAPWWGWARRRVGHRPALLLLVAWVAAGCDDAPETAAVDAQPVVDAAVDRGPAPDAAALDRGLADAAEPDAADVDRGLADASEPDAAVLDRGLADAAEPDAADVDRGLADAAEPDAAELDAAPLDMAGPDMAAPDAAVIELDAALPDAAVPDAAVPDAAVPDAALALALHLDRAACNPAAPSVGIEARGVGLAPLARLQLGLIDAAGAPIAFPGDRPRVDLDVYGAGAEFTPGEGGWALRYEGRVAAALDADARVVLLAEDADGAEAQAVLACAAPAVVAAGADCTPIAAFARCPEGEGCAEARCGPATPPTLIDAAAAVDPAAAVFGLAVEARDAEADVVAARVVLLDAHGDALLAQALRIDLAIRADAQGLLGRGGGVLPEALARPGDVASAEIRAVDATGGESAPLRVPVRRPEPAFEGGGCDPLEAFDRCPEGLACVHVDGDPLARAFCAAPTPECPEAWAVATVDAAAAPPWQAEAPPGDPLTTPGQCGGSAPGHAVVFVAPSAGRYRVRLLDAPPEAVVVGRRLCALTTPRFEVGCGADWTVPLSAGASLALLVASPEAVTLEITPEAP